MQPGEGFSEGFPDATPVERAEVARRAAELQALHTERRDLIAKLEARLASGQTKPHTPALGPEWLWAEVGTPASWKTSPARPASLSGAALTAWARAAHATALEQRLQALDALLEPDARLAVVATADELRLDVGGRTAVHLYDRPDTPFIAVQWRHALRGVHVTEAFDGRRLVKRLLDLRTTTDEPLKARAVALDADIARLDATIAAREADLNALVFRLYGLTDAEVALITQG